MEINLMTSYDHLYDMELNAALAALTCHANTEKDFEADDVLKRIIKLDHRSILEHITITYSVKWISRALLQELSRHRHISLSVESTRHTLRKIINDAEVRAEYKSHIDEKYHAAFDRFVAYAWKNAEMTNDELKYRLPEFWPTKLVLTLNVSELRHIVKLRTAPAALKEFQELALGLVQELPINLRYLADDCIYRAEESNA